MNASTPLFIVLLNHWRAIAFGTVALAVLAAVGSLFLPKGYQAGCLVLVTPPKTASELKLAPNPIHMKTAYSLANSDYVLQRTLDILVAQRSLIEKVMESIQSEEGGSKSPQWKALARLEPSQISKRLDLDSADSVSDLWEDLPPIDLLPGFLELDTDYVASLDPILFKKHLSSRIRTSLENMHQVEYQPVLSLQAEWETPTGAALVAFAWGQVLIRTIREQYLEPTLELQERFARKIEGIRQQATEISQRIEEIKKENSFEDLEAQKRKGLVQLYGAVERISPEEVLPASKEEKEKPPLLSLAENLSEDLDQIRWSFQNSESLLKRRQVLQERLSASTDHDEILRLRGEIADIDQEMASLEKEVATAHQQLYEAYASIAELEVDRELADEMSEHLGRTGAFEAMNVNYDEMLGVRMMSTPTPPRTPVSPVIWENALLFGLFGFVLVCLMTIASNTLLRIPAER
ncbi:MAG: hypothetical protein KC944_08185, partial [Candidatus Omnitrophica bacterium]|nr:hypothetical protein [Candidatus Omnitrophota bacterium]